MYACVVKNSQGTWDVWGFAGYPSNQTKQDRLDAAIESGLPVTGMILTTYQWSASNGATFDGTSFSGGDVSLIPQDSDWTGIHTFGYLCNDTIIYGFIANSGSLVANQLNAIFESETTLIKVPDGQTANVGDIWDGEKIINLI